MWPGGAGAGEERGGPAAGQAREAAAAVGGNMVPHVRLM